MILDALYLATTIALAVAAVWLMATYRAPETPGATPQNGEDQYEPSPQSSWQQPS